MTIFRKIHVYTTPSLYKQQIHILHSSFTEYSSFVMHKFSSFWCLCSSGYVYTPSQEYFPCYLSSFPVIHFCHLVRFLMHTTFAMSSASQHQKYNHLLCYRNVLYITRWQWRWYQQQRVCHCWLFCFLLKSVFMLLLLLVPPESFTWLLLVVSILLLALTKSILLMKKRHLWVKLDLDGLNVFLSIFFIMAVSLYFLLHNVIVAQCGTFKLSTHIWYSISFVLKLQPRRLVITDMQTSSHQSQLLHYFSTWNWNQKSSAVHVYTHLAVGVGSLDQK